jgi:prepilin-type N-terminal cleavage/methylation domain-containing protein/prepilin-type processing-associated H-X9-DG protein
MPVRTRAFTLIELLVVVAIIAVLIAILLPSLGKAKFRAKATACAANMKMMGMGVATYAAEWNDAIPPPFRHPYSSAGKLALEYQPRLAWFLRDNNNGTPYRLYGVALLFAPKGAAVANQLSASNFSGTGQITDPRVYFCPAQTDSRYSWPNTNDLTVTWLQTLETIQGVGQATLPNAHMGYMYAPAGALITPAPGVSVYKFPYTRVAQIPKRTPMITDLMCDLASVAHVAGGGTGLWNVAFIDGHVNSATSSYVFAQFAPPINLNVDATMTGVDFAQPNGHFYKMTDDLVRNSGN